MVVIAITAICKKKQLGYRNQLFYNLVIIYFVYYMCYVLCATWIQMVLQF